MKALFAVAIVLIGSAGPSLAQKPEVFPGGVVNAATLAKADASDYWVAAGSLVAIFGRNLAATTASATSFPLPKTLAGTSVTFGGISAPLLYVSPTQINAPTLGLIGAHAWRNTRSAIIFKKPGGVRT